MAVGAGLLAGGRPDGTHEQRLARYTEDLYDVINERYEKASIVLTSDRDRGECPDLFGEALLASAALDRLTHGAHFVEITGTSFRAEHTKGATRNPAELGVEAQGFCLSGS